MSEYVESKVYPSEDEERLTQSAPEVRNLIQTNLHKRLREQEYSVWSRERAVMQYNMEVMELELERLSGALQDIQGHGDRQRQIIKDQQLQLDKMEGENKALQQEFCADKLPKTFIELELEEALEIEKAQSQKLHCELSKLREAVQAQEEQAKEEACNAALPETNTLTKKAKVVDRSEHSLQTKPCFFCKDKRSTAEEATAQYIERIESEVERQRQKKQELAAALKNAERELEAGWLRWQEEAHVEEELETEGLAQVTDWSEDVQKPCFFCKNKKNATLAEIEEYIVYIVSQLKRQIHKKLKLTDALKKAEWENSSLSAQLQGANLAQPDAWIQTTKDLMADLTRKHEDQTASFIAQLEEQTQRNTTLAAALEEAEREKLSLSAQLQGANLAQLHEQKRRNTELLDALEEAEWKLEAGRRQQQDMALVDEELEFQQQDMALVEEELEKLRVETEGLAKVVDQSEQLRRTKPSFICKKKKSTTQESKEEHIALILSQLEQEKQKKQKLEAALEKAEHELEAGRIRWEEEAHVKKELEKQRVETNAAKEEYVALIVSQLERQRQKKQKLAAALEKAEQENSSLSAQLKDVNIAQLQARIKANKDLMADLTRKHVAQTASTVAQLVEEKERNSTLAATLKKTKRELKDKSSLLQATEDLNETLREKEQEWNESESTLKTQLADLQNQIAKKKNKWLRRLFCCTPQH